MNEKILWLVIERYLYTIRTTIGRLKIMYDIMLGPEIFCYTLEDTARPRNIKVYSETCLPGGLECDVSLFENLHYGKTIIFHTEKDGRTILFPPLKWVDCLAHNGINYDHTAGCLMLGSNLNLPVYANGIVILEPTIYGGMKEGLRVRVDKAIGDGYTIKARFVNLDQLT